MKNNFAYKFFGLPFFILLSLTTKIYSQHTYLIETTQVEIYSPKSLNKSKIGGTISEIISLNSTGKSKDISSFKLEQGECFDDLCFVGIQVSPSKRKFAVIQYQLGNLTKTIHIFSPLSFTATLKPLVANLKSPLDVIQQFQKLFPDNQWMGGQNLIFSEGRWIDKNLVMMPFSGQKDWNIPDLLQKIESFTIERSGGHPVLDATSFKDCRTFRLSLLGTEALPTFAQDAADQSPQIPYFEKMIRIKCKTPDGKLGYCSSPTEDYDGALGFSSECIAEDAAVKPPSAPSLNSCGGPKESNYLDYMRIWSSWQDSSLTRALVTTARSRDGKSCKDPDGLDLLIDFEKTENYERKSIALKIPASTKDGYCLSGRCLSKDFNFCAIKATHLELSIQHSVLEEWWGVERAKVFREDRAISEATETDLKQRLKTSEDRLPFLYEISGPENLPNGTACPGGICEEGKCRPWEEISSRYDKISTNPSTQCDQKSDGDSCITDLQRRGNCFLSQCLECKTVQSKGEWIEELVGALNCPLKKDLFPESKTPRRKSCAQPRVCSYYE